MTRLRRAAAAVYFGRRLGKDVRVNTIRVWPIRYRQVGRDAIYEIADLDAFADAKIAAAPRRRAGPSPDFARCTKSASGFSPRSTMTRGGAERSNLW